ncbi:MAG TPA: FAD-binding oxidoreductase [Aggregatilineales bacterium]|nr:FAD-binding oxidoreductase [Aggregatilineales bacterium]
MTRRWNGWGDDSVNPPLHGLDLITRLVGSPVRLKDATLGDVLRTVPPSRLPAHALIKTDPEIRLRHARGQSFPDWVALRSGEIGVFPDGVAFPESADEVAALLRFARDHGVWVIPYGGGTSVVGHINPRREDAAAAPILKLSLARLNRLQGLDRDSQIATFGAGANGVEVESQLRAAGYTLGHFPQSWEYSTIGGWVAARSSGQQSLYYGRIERLFAGGRVETPIGRLDLPVFPASAAGIDLREIVLGSEGRLGVLTDAAMRVMPLPEREVFTGVFFPDFAAGMAAARSIVQAGVPLSMLRLSNPTETLTNLALAGREQLIALIESVLGRLGISAGKCLLLMAATGQNRLVRAALAEAGAWCRKHGGVSLGRVGRLFGSTWRKGRFRTPYLRNTLWESGYAVDTLETATTWANVPATMKGIEDAIRPALSDVGERVHVFTHLSHVYPHGASIYTTYVFRPSLNHEETLRRWFALKDAASRVIMARGATISHQHGVGLDHTPYLKAEKGVLGLQAMGTLFATFDPEGLMNPGKLLP